MPASRDDSLIMELRPTLEVIAAEHELHYRRPEVRGGQTRELKEI